MALSGISGRGDPWSCGGMMHKCWGLLERSGGRGWVGEHPHRGKGRKEREVVGWGACGGVTGKWDII